MQTEYNGFEWAKLECKAFSYQKLTGIKVFYCDLETINPNPNRRSNIMEVMQFIIYISTCFFVSAICRFLLLLLLCFFFGFFFLVKHT